MTLVGAFILPHGAMILDPSREGLPAPAKDLHHAMKQVTQTIEDLRPDIIFLTTPHGIALSDEFGIYLNRAGSGSAVWQGEYEEFTVQVDFAQSLASQLLEFLKEEKVAASGIAAFTSGEEAPFRWGEAVPLWFLRDLSSQPKYLLLSQPIRRHEHAVEMIPELLELGRHLRAFFDSLGERVVVVISADLAHTHSADGPYKYSETAKPFDKTIEQWASTLNPDLLLRDASALLDKALCCGYLGFVILQGMLEGTDFQPKVFIRANPTYYGMLVAEYTL